MVWPCSPLQGEGALVNNSPVVFLSAITCAGISPTVGSTPPEHEGRSQ